MYENIFINRLLRPPASFADWASLRYLCQMFPQEKIEFRQADLTKLREITGSGPKKMVVVSHTNPDGDAVGSSMAMAEWLRGKGHDVTCVMPNKFPYFLDWMPGISEVAIFKDDADGSVAARISEADVIFCLDFNMISRLEGLENAILANKDAFMVLVDHHLDPPKDFGLSFSYTQSSSTAYLVYKLIEALDGGEAITRDMAEWLFVGIMTDTGNFSFSNLTADLFETVAAIVRKGVNIPQVHSNVYNNFTADRVKLLGYAIGKMETMKVGGTGVAYITLTEAELRKFHFQPGDSEGFVNYPLTIRDLDVSAIFIQTRNFIRISLRSRGNVDVSLFARTYFEGGGHKNASGGKSFKSMAETVEYFRGCVKEFFSDKGAGNR